MLNRFVNLLCSASVLKVSDKIRYFFAELTLIDYIDLALVVVLFATFWYFTKKSRIAHFLSLVITFGIFATLLAETVGFRVFAYVLRCIVVCGVLGSIVLFVFRISDFVMKGGEHSFLLWFKQLFGKKEVLNQVNAPLDDICKAAVDLSRSQTGGLIVIERKNRLDSLIQSGVALDAAVSPYLIRNIFYEGAPLHDGAILIRNGRIDAAGCILPVTHSAGVDPDLGTRHRAAIGLSESSDAVIVVISEESGSISVASEGVLLRGYDSISLKEELTRLLAETSSAEA